MAGEFNKFARRIQPQLAELSEPRYVGEAAEQDMQRGNVEELQQSMASRRHQSPMQQQVLGDELKRIKMMQTMQLQRAAQAMPPQLQQSLSPAKTGEPWPSPEAMMVRMMLQMQRRCPGMQGGPTPQQPF